MKLLCTQENFKKAILSVEKVTSKQITLPILKNILLETRDGRLIFSATNLEIGVECKIGAKIEEDGAIAVPAKLLSDFVLNLPYEKNINIELDGQILKITCGKYKAKINSLDPEDFPIIPKKKNNYQFSIESDILKNIINKTLSSVSLNDTRIEFTGVNVNFNENDVTFASTDSFRLVKCKVSIKKIDKYNELNGESIIIPAETLREVNKIISSSEDNRQVNIIIENNQIFFNINDIKIVSRLINGKYPDYNQIIPDKFKTTVIIDKEELLRSIKIASVFTKIKEGEIKLKVVKNKLIIKSELIETGENEVEIDIEKEGDDQEVILNPKYIIDGLNTIKKEKILLVINDNKSPIGIKIINESENIVDYYVYIIMPIKK